MLVYLYQSVGFTTAGIAALTVILTVAKIWDAVNDLAMGVVIDHTRTRWGKLRPYILFTAAPVAVLTILMFAVPNISETGKLVYFGVIYLLWDVVYTLCDVPYWGLSGAMSSDTEERTGVISLTRTLQTVATGVIVLMGPHIARWLSFSDKTTASGWTNAAAAISICGMAMFTLAFFNTRERIALPKEKTTLKQNISTIFKNKPLFLVLTGSTLGFGRNIVSVGGAVVAFIIFGDEGKFTLLGAALIASLIISNMLTSLVLKIMPKKTLMIGSSILASIFYVVMYLVGYRNIVTVLIMLFIVGLFSGFFIVVQTAMIADSVDYGEYKSGERNEGICFAGLTFVSKLMGAIATMAFGVAVAYVGYSKGAEITGYIQNGVYFAITIIPAISCLIGAIPFFFYDLTEKTMDEIMPKVLEKRKQRSNTSGISM
jgi:GPH family glycoside/pentoside/hexuronide:cation symporter